MASPSPSQGPEMVKVEDPGELLKTQPPLSFRITSSPTTDSRTEEENNMDVNTQEQVGQSKEVAT